MSLSDIVAEVSPREKVCDEEDALLGLETVVQLEHEGVVDFQHDFPLGVKVLYQLVVLYGLLPNHLEGENSLGKSVLHKEDGAERALSDLGVNHEVLDSDCWLFSLALLWCSLQLRSVGLQELRSNRDSLSL